MASNNVETFEWACAHTQNLDDFIAKDMVTKWTGWEFVQAITASAPRGVPRIYVILRRVKK